MKKRESTGSARNRRKVLKQKTKSLKIEKENPVILENELGEDAIERDPYEEISVEKIEVLWGALKNPTTNVMKLLTQMAESVLPVKYPTEDMLEKLALRMVKVQGLSPPEVKIVAMHNFFSVGLQAIPVHTIDIKNGEDMPSCFTINGKCENKTVRMFYKQKGLEETEMSMAFNVMTLFKHLLEMAQASTPKRLMIADMCEVWGISTQWMKWYYVDEARE